jgi:hypothetical protein
MNPVAVIIPTFRRPQSLERAVRSVLAQRDFGTLVHELLVVDNDPAASARDAVKRLQSGAPRLRYLHCPEAGVSNARNAGVAATTAPLVGFLDDDEAAPSDWLASLYSAHRALRADVTFGPVRGQTERAPGWIRDYLEAFFSRTGPAASGLSDTVYGCGNAMLTRATCLDGAEPFDPRANETGGEDDRLFQTLKAGDRRFAWAAEAWVWEHAAESRQTLRYALTRAFGYGQSPCQIAARKGCWDRVAQWMAIGAAQAVGFGLAAVVTLPVRPTRGLQLLDRAARGLGKLFWFKTLRFYGVAAKPARGRYGIASRTPVAASMTQSRSL